MSDLRRFLRRLAAFFRPEHAEWQLEREVQAHLELLEERYRARGLEADAARWAARRELRAESVKNQQRAARSFVWLEDLRQDVRHAWRVLARTPGFTTVAIVTLALGIGVNTAVFSLIHAVVFKPLPYHDPDRLVMIWAVSAERASVRQRATGPEFLAWQREATAFEAIATEGQQQRDLGADDSGAPAERVTVQRLQSGLFGVLGIRPMAGRPFTPEEERVGSPAPVALLSERLWVRRFNSDREIVGKTIRLDGQPTQIVGIMPHSFSYLSSPGTIDLYVPFAFNATQVKGSGRGYAAVARLKPGVTIAQAQADMDAVVARVATELPEPSKGYAAWVQPLHAALYGDSASTLWLLESIVALVLLIACANVAGLLVARGVSRSTEICVRAAMGAGRLRIVRQLLTESGLLAVLGGGAGISVALLLLKTIRTINPGWAPRLDEVAINGPVLVFTLLVSLVTGVIFGCLPAMQASKVHLVESLKTATKGSANGTSRHHVRNALVVVQIALAVVLLVGSGLVVRSLIRLRGNDLGMDPRGLLTVTVPFQGARYFQSVGPYKGLNLIQVSPQLAAVTGEMLDGLQRLHGVESVAGISAPPFAGVVPSLAFTIDGRTPLTEGDAQSFSARYHVVTPGYFRTTGIPVLAGRDFDARDGANTPWSVVVNEAMARQFWGAESPLGQRVTIDLVPEEQPREVIGVVRNVRLSPYDTTTEPAVYTLFTQQAPRTLGPIGTPSRNAVTFVLRAGAEPAGVAAGIRRVMAELDRDRPMTQVRRLDDTVAASTGESQKVVTLFSLLTGVALLLATIGVYGVVSHGVAQRGHEIGIRMALGASVPDIRRLILREIGLITAVGVAVGLGLAVALTAQTSAYLFNVSPTDPATYAVVGLVVGGTALMASWIPSTRATRVAPTVALRSH